MRVRVRLITLLAFLLLMLSHETSPPNYNIKGDISGKSHKKEVFINFLFRFCTMSFITIQFHYLIIAFFFLLSFLVYSQNSDFAFEHFSVEQGLSSANVGAIYQDSTGYLWLGTYNGIDRYDGYGFTSYKYPGDSVILVNEFPCQ